MGFRKVGKELKEVYITEQFCDQCENTISGFCFLEIWENHLYDESDIYHFCSLDCLVKFATDMAKDERLLG